MSQNGSFRRVHVLWVGCALALTLNGAYLYGFGEPTLFYVGNVFAHLALGVTFAVLGVAAAHDLPGESRSAWRPVSSALLISAAITGGALVYFGNAHPQRLLLWSHIGLSIAGVVSLTARLMRLPRARFWGRLAVWSLLLVPLVVFAGRLSRPSSDTITNPSLAPIDMAGESQGGADGAFFPSAAATADGKLIPSSFFMESKGCAQSGCHPDVTAQWEGSAHHLSSFNNQWYAKSIEYMQDVAGLDRPKWCAGCHDHALLFSGMMDQPVEDFRHTPEAQAGLACVSCHRITSVQHTMGNGGFTIDYPPLHELATSSNPWVRGVHDFLVKIAPEPHRRTFLRPFMREQSAEFCSTCHKVHLDEPVNGYRWVRGFNTYDNWQASGVSGQGARSFYAPPEPMTCVTCHMQQVPSTDAASKHGLIRTHRFAAANTALPTAEQDSVQLAETTVFLQGGKLLVDIFAVGEPSAEADTVSVRRFDDSQTRLATTFAIGEEQGQAVGTGSLTRSAARVFAPLDGGEHVLYPGSTARLDVVVRTLDLGHFFPTGTVDAQEAWLEVRAVDGAGHDLLWSGRLADDGVVDPAAHFYRNLMVDEHGNRINKRNAFAARAVVYVNLIPPGAADVAHFRLSVPEDVVAPVRVVAALHYRKFSKEYTDFAFRGIPLADGARDVGYDDRPWGLAAIPGAADIPVVPVVTLATDSLSLGLAHVGQSFPDPLQNQRQRWNDYGIALLLEGDLRGAEQAFRQVVTIDQDYADGWVNLARVYLGDGDVAEAAIAVQEALNVQPGFHKALFFRGLYYKALGDYPPALEDLELVSAAYPRDRVVLNQIGRVHYLMSNPESAIPAFRAVLAIDPEDLMAHYNLMLCYRAVGDIDRSAAHEARYLRYKADESTQERARTYRARDANANNEALPIHEHKSVSGTTAQL